MDKSFDLRGELEKRFIEPARGKCGRYAGAEFEIPIVNLGGGPSDYGVIHDMTEAFAEHFDFGEAQFDDEGYVYFARNEASGDSISFDCSYNTFEIAFGREKDLGAIAGRFYRYYDYAYRYLYDRGHALTGMGINPGYRVNLRRPVANGRYRMLLHHLESYRDYPYHFNFHDVPYYGLIVCSEQTHVDVNDEDLVSTLGTFEMLEPLKGLLFANSPYEGGYLCARDHFWRESMHGVNPRNVEFWGDGIRSDEDIVDFLAGMSLFCTEQDGKYINFRPTPADEYFALDHMRGEYWDGSGYSDIEFSPEPGDIAYLRSYKFVDLTFRGTLELRSTCTQPVYQIMSVPAFNVGIQEKLDEVRDLIMDSGMLSRGYDLMQLRRMSVMRELPDFMKGKAASKLLQGIVDLAAQGLRERGYGEERYIEPLYPRAEQIMSPGRELVEGLESGQSVRTFIDRYSSADHV